MGKSYLLLVALLLITIASCGDVMIRKGKLRLQVLTPNEVAIKHTLDINLKYRNEITLIQSSKVKVQAEIDFSQRSFIPEFFSFRFVHNKHNNLTQPVLAVYNAEETAFLATLDLGDPHFIQPFSDTYELEILIGDDRLDTNFRNTVARVDISFAHSLTTLPPSDFFYDAKPQIHATLPPAREDPPVLFTYFVSALVVLSFVGFLYGLNYLRANLDKFPGSGTGLILNSLFLAALLTIFFILVKFWINWTFLQTIQYLLAAILPTAVIGNYAILSIKK